MNKKIKIAKDVPIPETITPEVSKQLVQEGLEMAREIQEKIKAMQLTVEDWRTIIK